MEGVQIMDTPVLDMQPACYTPPASFLDKGKRKICDLYDDQQLLCNFPLALLIMHFINYPIHEWPSYICFLQVQKICLP